MKIVAGLIVSLMLLFLIVGCAPQRVFTENRALELATEGVQVLEITGGNGDIGIKGTASAKQINVSGDISISGEDTGKIREMISNQLIFTLEKRGNRAVLHTHFTKSFFLLSMFLDRGRKIDVNIELPPSLKLSVTDNGGNLYIADMKNDIVVHDEDGVCIVENVSAKSVEITDNAGQLVLSNVLSDIDILDKSGDIELSLCSGKTQITDTTGDLMLEMCKGPLSIDDSTGKITVEDHNGDVTIVARGRGDVSLQNVTGKIIQNY